MSQGGSGTGSGFTSGEDFVAARVSIDIDNQGVQTLKELSNALQNYRTVVEAAGRSSENFIKYLQQMQQAGQQVAATHQQMAQALQASGDVQNRTMGTGGNPMAELPMSRMAPTAYVDPFSGTGAGMGRQAGAGAGSVQEQIQQQYIDPARQLDPYRYAQAQAGRYRTLGTIPTTPTGAPDWNEYSSRIDARDKATATQAQTTPAGPEGGAPTGGGLGSDVGPGPLFQGSRRGWGGLARNIANEMAPGGTPLGTIGAVAQGIGAVGGAMAGRMSGGPREPSGAGPGASGIGPAQQQNAAAAGRTEDPGEVAEGGIPALLGGSLGHFAGGALSALPGGKLLAPLLAKLGPGAGILGGALGLLGAVQKGGAMYQGYKDIGLIQGGGAAQGFGDEMRMRWNALDPRISTGQSREIMMAGLSEGYHGKDYDVATKAFKDNLVDFNLAVGDSVKLLRTSILGGSTLQEAGQQSHAIMQAVKNMSRNGIMSAPDMQQSIGQLTQGFTANGMLGSEAMKEAATDTQMWNTPETRGLQGDFGPTVQAFTATPGSNAALEAFSGDVVPGLMPQALAFYNSRHGKKTDEDVDKALKRLIGMYFRSPGSRDKDSIQYASAVAMVQNQLNRIAPGNKIGTDMNTTAKAVDAYIFSGKDYYAQASSDADAAGANNIPTSTDIGSSSYGSDRSAAISSQYGSQANASGEMVFSRPQEMAPRSLAPMAVGTAAAPSAVQHNVNFAPAQVHITVGRDGSATVSPNPVQLTPNQQAANQGAGTATHNNPPPGEDYYRGGLGMGGAGLS